jgi:hypothetical protein
MVVQDKAFTPGKILHDSVVGALRQKGMSLSRWCTGYGILESTAKAATYGQMSGPKGQEIRDALIESAGIEQVSLSYRHRICAEADAFRSAHQPASIAA